MRAQPVRRGVRRFAPVWRSTEKSPGHRGAVTGAKSILSLARGLDAGAVYFAA